MKKQIFIVLAISLIFLFAGCGQQQQAAKPAGDGESQTFVDENVGNEEPIEKTVQTFGVVKTKNVNGIMIDLPAVIEEIHVQEGDRVKKSDTLITLNLKEIEGQIREKEDLLKVAKLELQKMNAKAGDNSDIQKTINDLELAKKQYDIVKEELTKKEALLNEGAISQNDYNEFKKNVQLKQKEVENCQLSLDSLKQNSQVQEALDIEIKKQNIASLENSLKILKDKIRETGIEGDKIVCDVENGLVEHINNAVGDRLNAEKQIMSILDLDTLVVKANVVEDFIKDVSLGNKAVITPLADSTKQYEGKVTRIANMAIQDNGETVVPVEIEVENADEFLLPNFNVNIKIIVD